MESEKSKVMTINIVYGLFLILNLKSIFLILYVIYNNSLNISDLKIMFFFFLLFLLILSFFSLLGVYLKNLNLKISDERIKQFESIQKENLEFVANRPYNPIKDWFYYNKNKPGSQKFSIFGYGILQFILFVFILVIYFREGFFISIKQFLLFLFLLMIFHIIVTYSSKSTSRKELEFREELERKKALGQKPGFLDELSLKLMIILFSVTLILLLIIKFLSS